MTRPADNSEWWLWLILAIYVVAHFADAEIPNSVVLITVICVWIDIRRSRRDLILRGQQ